MELEKQMLTSYINNISTTFTNFYGSSKWKDIFDYNNRKTNVTSSNPNLFYLTTWQETGYFEISFTQKIKITILETCGYYGSGCENIKQFKILGSNDNFITTDIIYTGTCNNQSALQSFTINFNKGYNKIRIYIDSWNDINKNDGQNIANLLVYGVPQLPKNLIKQNSNYYSINNNYINLGEINNNEELNNLIDNYGYDNLSIITKELNNKKIPTKLENGYCKSLDVNLNEVKDNISFIEKDDEKYIQYDCDKYRIIDKIKEINNGKFDVIMK